jgi:F-box protein, helicase, 18
MDKPHIENNHTCYLARNNLRLLSKLIEFVGSGGTEFAFEGSIDQSIYTQDGVSIYDIYALFAGKRDYMRSDFIKAFGSWKEFLQYIDLMEDFELKILAGLVVKYRGEIFSLLKKIKATEKSKKDSRLIFSSAHKSKGLEYGKVYLLDDFLQKEEFESLLRIKSNIPEQSIGKTVSLESVNQELNLLYVAVTRTVNELFLSGEIPLFSSLPPSYSNRASLGKRI